MKCIVGVFIALTTQSGNAQLTAERLTASSENFTGEAWVERFITADNNFAVSISRVGFEPGARTNWHTHIPGQVLIIEEGVAYYQELGQEKKVLKAGDIVKCSPMTTHWHGASPEGPMIHLAMTPTREVNWLEAVTDEVYHSNGSVE